MKNFEIPEKFLSEFIEKDLNRINNNFEKRRLRKLMGLFNFGKRITIKEATIFEMLIKETMSIENLNKVAEKMTMMPNTMTDSKEMNLDIIMEACIKNNFLNLNLTHLVDLAAVHNVIPAQWIIRKALYNEVVLPEYDYSVLANYPQIMSELLCDLNLTPVKYINVNSKVLYSSIAALKEYGYDWIYYVTILLKHRPDSRFLDLITADSEVSKFVKYFPDILKGKIGMNMDASRSIIQAIMPDTDYDCDRPKFLKVRETEDINISVSADRSAVEIEASSIAKAFINSLNEDDVEAVS